MSSCLSLVSLPAWFHSTTVWKQNCLISIRISHCLLPDYHQSVEEAVTLLDVFLFFVLFVSVFVHIRRGYAVELEGSQSMCWLALFSSVLYTYWLSVLKIHHTTSTHRASIVDSRHCMWKPLVSTNSQCCMWNLVLSTASSACESQCCQQLALHVKAGGVNKQPALHVKASFVNSQRCMWKPVLSTASVACESRWCQQTASVACET